MKIKTLLIVVISFFCLATLSAQKKDKVIITGTVTDASKRPIMNAMIMIDNVKTSAVTDANGNYKIKVKAGAQRIGIVTFGQGMKEEDISGRSQIDFVLTRGKVETTVSQDIPASETTVNEGYSNIKKKNTLSDQSIVNPGEKKKTYSSVYEMIQEIPGVSVTGGSTINIRGAANLWGPVAPLLILDGVPVNDFSNVSPTQVESVNVLKGASAAIYGSRGYGGVVVVKTKKIQVDK